MIKRFGRPSISKHEIIADLIFLFVAMGGTFLALYAFDIHWSLYPEPGNTIFPPNRHIFKDPWPYYTMVPIGGLIGLFLIKILFYAFREEEEAIKERVKLPTNGQNPKKKGKSKRSKKSR
ncbi:hypothetical protein HZC08_01570 [Candidatus Micrarchaeota archaeon]|nr:hypothetical protein [Candidatus Micrarchaeota archaeon]